MKRGCAILMLAFVVGLAAFAQPQRMTPQERTDRLAKELNLTGEQKARVLEHFTQEQKNFQKLSGDMQGDREAMRSAWQKRLEESNKKMKEILTPEQYARYEQMRPAGPRGGRGEVPPPGEAKKPQNIEKK